MLAWAFHRISGRRDLAVRRPPRLRHLAVGANPKLYDDLLAIYASPIGRIIEMLLGAALLYHALNGLRIVDHGLLAGATRFHHGLWYLNWVGVRPRRRCPVAFVILGPFGRVDGVGGTSGGSRTPGTPEPAAGGLEVAVWYLMRMTGLGLFVLVLSHYLILHVLYSPADQHSGWIDGDALGEHVLAGVGLADAHAWSFHAFMGMRMVVGDYTIGRRRGSRSRPRSTCWRSCCSSWARSS